MDNYNIIFTGERHQQFFEESMCLCRNIDVYHMALIYCLGISNDTRERIDSIYDFKSGDIRPECLKEGWITSGSARVIRLAFNLYTNGAPSVLEEEEADAECRLEECRNYLVDELFCCSYAKYFWQAIQIRYPEFCV